MANVKIRVGNLSFNPEKDIGEGFFGTVYEGTFHTGEDDKPVAVKRILKRRGVDESALLREVELMKIAEGHPNILHVIDTEKNYDFL